MDAEALLWNLILIGVSVICHCYIAYTKAGKMAVKAVKNWLSSEDGQEAVVTYLVNALNRPTKDGKTAGTILSSMILDKFREWAKSEEAAGTMAAAIEAIQNGVFLKLKQMIAAYQTNASKLAGGVQASIWDQLKGQIMGAIVKKVSTSLDGIGQAPKG